MTGVLDIIDLRGGWLEVIANAVKQPVSIFALLPDTNDYENSNIFFYFLLFWKIE